MVLLINLVLLIINLYVHFLLFQTRRWLKAGESRSCGCKLSIYIAPSRINEINSDLKPSTIIKAIDHGMVDGCNRKAVKFNNTQVRFASHVKVEKQLSTAVTNLFGMLSFFFDSWIFF